MPIPPPPTPLPTPQHRPAPAAALSYSSGMAVELSATGERTTPLKPRAGPDLAVLVSRPLARPDRRRSRQSSSASQLGGCSQVWTVHQRWQRLLRLLLGWTDPRRAQGPLQLRRCKVQLPAVLWCRRAHSQPKPHSLPLAFPLLLSPAGSSRCAEVSSGRAWESREQPPGLVVCSACGQTLTGRLGGG
jgi:hypothetical protein